MIDFTALFSAIDDRLITLLVLTALDFVLGTIMALVQGKFAWEKLTSYLQSDILPILAWMAVELIAALPQNVVPDGAITVVPVVVYTTVFLRITASVLGHIAEMGIARGLLGRIGVDAGKG